MDFAHTNTQLAFIGEALERSLQRHIVDNDTVRSAFAELAFELDLAREIGTPIVRTGLIESTI